MKGCVCASYTLPGSLSLLGTRPLSNDPPCIHHKALPLHVGAFCSFDNSYTSNKLKRTLVVYSWPCRLHVSCCVCPAVAVPHKIKLHWSMSRSCVARLELGLAAHAECDARILFDSSSRKEASTCVALRHSRPACRSAQPKQQLALAEHAAMPNSAAVPPPRAHGMSQSCIVP